ncbi:ACP S-malonyltransferase [Paenibacillus massiliensis]|uniref:ACP S-malonyltransferase n=1 Tax=Paenibacillus massiliensis TaxID=225917 RepID=UPI000364D91F|nr:ACP S-malonyltransferase [Paenibacillus massiliensis]
MDQIALLFSGQGSQYKGMAQREYDRVPAVRSLFAEAEGILGWDVKKLCFEDPDGRLSQTRFAQPALYTVCMGMFIAFQELAQDDPAYVAGHSLGEYAALTAAGAMTFRDGLKLVQHRGHVMQEAAEHAQGSMYVIRGLEQALVEAACRDISKQQGYVVVANYNSSEQHVISGTREGVSATVAQLERQGATAIPMAIQAPFHSKLMDAAALSFRSVLDEVSLTLPQWPVISNVTGLPYPEDIEQMKDLLASQIKLPVLWNIAMSTLHHAGIDTVLEIGPRHILRNLAVQNYPGMTAYAWDQEEDRAIFLKGARDRDEQRSTMASGNMMIQKCIAAAVSTRNRNWSESEYQEGVVRPYREVKELFFHLKDSGGEANEQQVQQARRMLESVLATKKVPREEQASIWQDILHPLA